MPTPGTNELPDSKEPFGVARLAFCTISAAVGAVLFTSCLPPWRVDLSDAAFPLVLCGWLFAARARPEREGCLYVCWVIGGVQLLAVLCMLLLPGGLVRAPRQPAWPGPLQAWNAACGIFFTGFIFYLLSQEWRLWRSARKKTE